MPADWSAFDARKLRLSLRLLEHCAAFLRLVTSPQRQTDVQRTVRAVNTAALAEAFCQCAAAGLRLSPASAPSEANREWLLQSGSRAEEDELAGALLRVTESLACAVHNCALVAPGQLAVHEALRVVDAAEMFPAHSFTRQVARWIKDLQLK